APTSGKRSSLRIRKPKPSSALRSSQAPAQAKSGSAFGTSKKDKRIIKHAALVSRIEKSNSASKKRRRPSKKLVANLESLVEALPEVPTRAEAEGAETPTAKIKHRSLKSKPGAMKKKENIIRLEKDRFNQNMAQLASMQQPNLDHGHKSSAGGAEQRSNTSWATLRNFIQQNVEQRAVSS
ncbi:MAG: hypothetical protein Q9183_007789, partial [Haloplaca sp. 2 TL-2023]